MQPKTIQAEKVDMKTALSMFLTSCFPADRLIMMMMMMTMGGGKSGVLFTLVNTRQYKVDVAVESV